MKEIEAVTQGLHPRRVVIIVGPDGEDVELFLWPFLRPLKRIGKRVYRPEPTFHPY